MAVVYLVSMATTSMGITPYKYFESSSTPLTMKYMVQIENEMAGTSMEPLAAHENTSGSEIYIKHALKLCISLKRCFSSKYNPMTPKINIIASNIIITLLDMNPARKIREVKNGISGGIELMVVPPLPAPEYCRATLR